MSGRPFIVFDCDGTLTDSHHVIVETMMRAFEAHNLKAPTDTQTRGVIGLSLPVAIEHLAPAHAQAAVPQLVQSYKEIFRALRASGQAVEGLYPHVRSCLTALKQAGAILGIATGKSRRGLESVLETHDLGAFFVTLQTADTNLSKPHPEMLETAMADAGAEPNDTVMIGDSPFDIQMALAAGTHAVGVEWSDHGPAALRRAGAHSILRGYQDWQSLLQFSAVA
ncbi:MAG: HAD-IA family hydrolase [Pseudomonadota bacterium]